MGKYADLVKKLYKFPDGTPFTITPSQEKIFQCIVERKAPDGKHFVEIETTTQFGKSDIASMAILTAITHFPTKYSIVAPNDDKAHLIMGYLIDHIFDNYYIKRKFVLDKGESYESIRRHKSRDRVNFKLADGGLGEVFVISAQNKSTKNVVDALMGFGAPNVLLDESAVITDMHYDAIWRMVGGHTTKDYFFCELINPLRRNHAMRTHRDPDYHHIWVNWELAVKEGRYSLEWIEKTRRTIKPVNWRVFYEVLFPDENMMDADGWYQLIPDSLLESAFARNANGEPLTLTIPWGHDTHIGWDIADSGLNKTAGVLRNSRFARIIYLEHTPNQMAIVPIIERKAEETGVPAERNRIDFVGIGKGLYSRLHELNFNIKGVNVGWTREKDEKPPNSIVIRTGPDPRKAKYGYKNLRAELCVRVYEWLRDGGQLEFNEGWYDLLRLRARIGSEKIIEVMSKRDMMAEGLESPDVADAFALTMEKDAKPATKKESAREEQERQTSQHARQTGYKAKSEFDIIKEEVDSFIGGY